jgi:uncharacterized RDD family membrane protein YckC
VEAYLDEPVFPYTYAPWPRRIASAAIDFIVITAISVPFLAPTLSRVVNDSTETTTAAFTTNEIRTLTIITIVLQVGYFTLMHAWRGSTVGKMATRTVLVRDEGQPVSTGVAFIRAVSLVGINFASGFLLLVPAIVNLLSPLWNPRRQTFHDRFAKTIVVLRDSMTE